MNYANLTPKERAAMIAEIEARVAAEVRAELEAEVLANTAESRIAALRELDVYQLSEKLYAAQEEITKLEKWMKDKDRENMVMTAWMMSFAWITLATVGYLIAYTLFSILSFMLGMTYLLVLISKSQGQMKEVYGAVTGAMIATPVIWFVVVRLIIENY
jgi:hypothetical protein